MKPKLLLTIVLLNPLFLGVSIATASSMKPEYDTANLSQTISKLVGLNGDKPKLVKSAIDRALRSKQKAVNPHVQPLLGRVSSPPKPEQLGGQG